MNDSEIFGSVSKDCLAWVRQLARSANVPTLGLPGSPVSRLLSLPRRAFRWAFGPPGPPALTGGQVAELVSTLTSAGNLLDRLSRSAAASESKESHPCQTKCSTSPRTSPTPPSLPPSVG